MPRYSDPQRQELYVQRLRDNRKGLLLGESNPAKRPEVRAKISAKLKGRDAAWTEGDRNVAKRPVVREKIRNNINSQQTRFRKGQIPWNKSLTAKTNALVKICTQKATLKRRTEGFRQRARVCVLNNFQQGKLRSNSPAEKEMETILLGLDLVKDQDYFHQYIIGDFVFDFYIKRANMVIEIDGREHRYSTRVRTKDALKEEYLRQNRISIMRFRNADVFNNRGVVTEITINKLHITQMSDELYASTYGSMGDEEDDVVF